jgi:hypothetical protein
MGLGGDIGSSVVLSYEFAEKGKKDKVFHILSKGFRSSRNDVGSFRYPII